MEKWITIYYGEGRTEKIRMDEKCLRRQQIDYDKTDWKRKMRLTIKEIAGIKHLAYELR